MEPTGIDEQLETQDKDPYWVEALSQGLAVLKAFDGKQSGMTLTEIAQVLGWRRAKPYRYVHTLEKMGYLTREDNGKRYRPTSMTMALGYAYLSGLSLLEHAQPVLNQLKTRLNASVHMGILERGEVVYIASSRVSVVPTVDIHVGSRVPPFATSIGRMLLAYLDADRVDELIGQAPLPAITARSITDPQVFRQMLHNANVQGYVCTDQEFHAGVRSIAAPVFDRWGKVVAAINATSIVQTFTDEYIESTVIAAVQSAAKEISMSLGHSS